MKILMQSRASLFRIPGGDTIQILKTKEHLEKRGVKVDISLEVDPDLSAYDIVHLFHFFRIHETYLQSKNARSQGKKVVLSPIYVSRTIRNYFEEHADLGRIKYINKIVGEEVRERLKGMWHYFIDKEKNDATVALIKIGYRRLQEITLDQIDMFLPNSAHEMTMLMNDFPGNYRYKVIPNAIEKSLFSAEVEFNKYDLPYDCILCVARIEPRKNQLAVIKALQGTDYKLVLAGDPVPNRMNYYRQVKKHEGAQVRIFSSVSQNELIYFYAFAKVHVLASWFESPGLSSLEAAATGCNIVASDQEIIKQYFNNYAFYCDPQSISSIREAIIAAYEAENDLRLRDQVIENYTWEKAADLTLQAYKEVLA